MIRRWSYVKGVNVDCAKFSLFEKRYKFRVFRASVMYKRPISKVTKYRRKSFARLRHKTNWVVYNNVFKTWVRDFAFNKHYARFQYYNKILLNNFLSYDFNFIKSRGESPYSGFNFILSTWTRRSYFYFRNGSFEFFKNAPISHAWFVNLPAFDSSVVPAYYDWENQLFPANFDIPEDFNINVVFDSIFNIFLKKSVEVRKLVTMLFYFKLNFKNVKCLCSYSSIILESLYVNLRRRETRIFTAAR